MRTYTRYFSEDDADLQTAKDAVLRLSEDWLSRKPYISSGIFLAGQQRLEIVAAGLGLLTELVME